MKLKLTVIKALLNVFRRQLDRRMERAGEGTGEPFLVPREAAPEVAVSLHRPAELPEKPLPVVFHVHGGAWVMGNHRMLDPQSQELAEKLGAMVVNIHYQTVDLCPFPYAQQEVYDTVRYFLRNADKFHLDAERAILMGYSAGAHLCASAAQMLRDAGIPLARQVLCYPFTDFTCGGGSQRTLQKLLDMLDFLDEVLFTELPREHPLCSPGLHPDLSGLAPALFVTCGKDPLRAQGEGYICRLREAGVEVTVIHCPEASHAFLEIDHSKSRSKKAAKQAALSRDCLEQIVKQLQM